MSFPRLHARTWVLMIVISLLALELGLRRAGYGREAVTESHPELGWTKQPNQQVRGSSGEGVHINRFGFRDRDWKGPAEPHLPVAVGGQQGLRVAVLGDSVAYGARLPREQGLAHWLEYALGLRVPEGVLVQNFSTPGWTLEQMARCYEVVASQWKPDIVILVMGTAATRLPLPVPSEPDYPLRRIIKSTAVWDFLRRNFWSDVERTALRAEARLNAPQEIVLDPLGEGARGSWEQARLRLGKLEKDLATNGGKLCLVMVPRFNEIQGPAWEAAASGEDLLGDHWQALLDPESSGILIDLRRNLRRRLLPQIRQAEKAGLAPHQVWSRRRNQQVQDVVDPKRSPYLLSDPLHLSELGHRIVAAESILRLENAGWVPRSENISGR